MRTPLTEAEHERIRELLDGCPRPWIAADDRLKQWGLVTRAPMVANWTKACLEQIGPGGIEPYYEADGNVNLVSYPIIGHPDVLDPGFELPNVPGYPDAVL